MNQIEWITPVTLESKIVRIEPLSVGHAAELCDAAVSAETFRYFSRIPTPWNEHGFAEYIKFLLGPALTVPFCVIDRRTGRPIGMTTYLSIAPANRSLEIGWTWLSPSARGTRINPMMKRLMLEHAFQKKGAIRVQLRTDFRNKQSRAAILKLGAVEEGVHRQDMLMHDGHWRDSVFFSILEEEWPHVRAGLDARLAETR